MIIEAELLRRSQKVFPPHILQSVKDVPLDLLIAFVEAIQHDLDLFTLG